MTEHCTRRVRKLYDWEIQEFTQVFGISLIYSRVRVHECASWPDWLDRLGRFLKRMPPPGLQEHNAITLGNHCFFPLDMPETLLPVSDAMSFKHDWLVHELTHAWQYQHIGWIYLIKALWAQFREKDKAYDFGGEEGLLKSRQKQIPFKKFNPEQQGNITETYFQRKRQGWETSAWDPYINDLKNTIFK